MNIPIDTINSVMNLAGGILALLAAVIAAITTTLPKNKATEVIANLRVKIVGFITTCLAIAAAVSTIAFGSLRFALFFIFICASLTSIQFLSGRENPTRVEIFMLIVNIAALLVLFIMYMLLRIISIIERVA